MARVRGAAMAELGSPTGAMLAVAAPWQDVQAMLNGEPLTIVGYNSPRQTVVAGEAGAVRNLARRAAARGLAGEPVAGFARLSHAARRRRRAGAGRATRARKIFGAGTRGFFHRHRRACWTADEDLRELLCRQVTSPVRFESALAALLGDGPDTKPADDGSAVGGMDLLIEVGPGAVLSNLARETADIPVVALDAGGNSLDGLLQAVGAAFALGAPVKHAALFADRFTRPFALDWKPKFFANPCELAPVSERVGTPRAVESRLETEMRRNCSSTGRMPGAPIELIRRLVAGRAELPAAAVRDESRMLSDLHLNSITVGQLVSEAAQATRLAAHGRADGFCERQRGRNRPRAGGIETHRRRGAKGRPAAIAAGRGQLGQDFHR